ARRSFSDASRPIRRQSELGCRSMGGHGSRAAVAAVAVAAAACSTPERCLAGHEACERADNCSGLDGVFLCAGAPELRVGTAETIAIDLEGAAGTGGDIVLQNGLVTAVLDDLASPRGLATTGGTL